MDIQPLVNLTSRAWSLKILALMATGVPGRQAPLLAATEAGRTAFADSLDHLVRTGLVERNPGHGHPLRPEFRLTKAGTDLAGTALGIAKAIQNEGEFAILRRRWTVPILAMTRDPQRFSALRSGLAPISDRALAAALQQLEAQNWVSRTIDASRRHPYPLYTAINRGREINAAIGMAA